LTERIIPSEDYSPGARAARVAKYLDQHFATSWEEALRRRWRQGLQLIDALSHELHGQPFLQAAPAQRQAVLECMAQNETTPQKPEEHFFVELKVHTARGYYTSQIGIHTELGYKGNTYLGEFVGEDLP
jgi:gluconate 2-dehydrogenase gamma chain